MTKIIVAFPIHLWHSLVIARENGVHIIDNFPANYNKLNWWVRAAILDPIGLKLWEISTGKIVPNEEEARKIGLANNWKIFLEE